MDNETTIEDDARIIDEILEQKNSTPEKQGDVDHEEVPEQDVIYKVDPMIQAFQEWLDEPYQGTTVTRRIQLRQGPAPDMTLGWAEIGFMAGLRAGVRSGYDVARADILEQRNQIVETTHVHGPDCNHD